LRSMRVKFKGAISVMCVTPGLDISEICIIL
jgi:hypothetical protein